MRQKMINLCPTTFEQASRMANFSEWVRMKIREEHLTASEGHLHLCIKGCQKVTEFSASPMCPIHKIRMELVPSLDLKSV